MNRYKFTSKFAVQVILLVAGMALASATIALIMLELSMRAHGLS